MRTVSFKTFLTDYVKKLSYAGTLNLKMLAEEMESNPRLVEVVFLYARVMEKEETLNKYLLDEFKTKFNEFKELFDENNDLEKQLNLTLENNTLLFDNPLYYYKKVYRSYLVVRDRRSNEMVVKDKMREKIFELKEKLGVSDYQLCKVAALNSGNFHSFMYNNNNDKLSMKKCNAVFDYLLEMN